jgi:hypothetical protein
MRTLTRGIAAMELAFIFPAALFMTALVVRNLRAFEQCISATSTRNTPWYIVPADSKENARLIVSQILLDTMKALGSAYPKLDAKRRRELRTIRSRLVK